VKFGWARIARARIRLIKLRIRAVSRKWNYRGVGGKCIGDSEPPPPGRVAAASAVRGMQYSSGGRGSSGVTACASNRGNARGGAEWRTNGPDIYLPGSALWQGRGGRGHGDWGFPGSPEKSFGGYSVAVRI